MARSINSSMIIFYIGMNMNTAPDNLTEEFSALANAVSQAQETGSGSAVVIARMLQDVAPERWRKAADDARLANWHAFAVNAKGTETLGEMPTEAGQSLNISPFREIRGALTPEMFVELLQRELLRLSRNGGCLSLISAGLAEKSKLADKLGEGAVLRLEATLGITFLNNMDACDSLGILRKGRFICSLPGMGQLAARAFAEKARSAFTENAEAAFGQSCPDCAIGIVNVLQGEGGTPKELLKRARTALEVALTKESGHIHQETSVAPLENTTLVQSSEKRFLFFGGDLS